MWIAIIILIYKAKYIFFPFYSTLILFFITITMFFFVKSYNLLTQKRQFWQFALGNFRKLVLITIYYLNLFKITKSSLKKICIFFCLKMKPLTQFANPVLWKLFFLIALLFFLSMCLIFNKIDALRPYIDSTLLKLFILMPLFFCSYNCLQSLEINIQSPAF